MHTYSVRVYNWEPLRQCNSELDLNIGEQVVVKEDLVTELGFIEIGEAVIVEDKKTTIVRKATKRDLETYEKNKEKKRKKTK